MDLAVFRFEYLQGTKQEFWILLADAVTDPSKTPTLAFGISATARDAIIL